MKIKMEFVLKETGERVFFETTLDNAKAHECASIVDSVNDDGYMYTIGGTKIWRPRGNMICAEDDLLSLRVEYELE